MNKETCCKEISRFIEQCRELRMADCENDFAKQRDLRDRINEFLQDNIVDAISWSQAVEDICFNNCSGTIYGPYDRRVSQELFINGVERLLAILARLKGMLDRCTDRDIRWNLSYKGGAQ